MNESRWHQCNQNSCCNRELKCIVYLCCCFLPVNWCRRYSFSVQIFPWNLLYKTEELLPLQSFCCYQRAVLSHELPAHAFSTGGGGGCSVLQTRNGCRSLGAVLGTGASVWELCLPFPAHINISEKYQFDLEGDIEKNTGWEREQEREKLPGWRGKGRSGQGKGNEDRQKDREWTVSPFMRKGSLQIRMTEFSCSGHFIPMNLQLNAEMVNKRRAKRRYCWIVGIGGCRGKLGKWTEPKSWISTRFPGILLWVGGVLEVLEASVIQTHCSGRDPLCFSPGCCHKERFYSISWCWVDRPLSTKQGVYSPGQALREALWTFIVVWLGSILSAAWIFFDLLPR